jgi:hypothetical protein
MDKKFGKWKVISNSCKKLFVICKCDCGTIKEVNKYNLFNGRSKACGCHRIKHNMSHSKENQKWRDMKDRCYNTNNKHYKDYGGRGIFVCRRWRKSFVKFFDDMGNCPEGQSIERIDNDLSYGPWNCCWESSRKQSYNRRSNKLKESYISEIKELKKSGKTNVWIANKFEVDPSGISRIVNGKAWRCV